MLFPWQPEEQTNQYVQVCPSVSVHECGYLDCICLCVNAGGAGQTVCWRHLTHVYHSHPVVRVVILQISTEVFAAKVKVLVSPL